MDWFDSWALTLVVFIPAVGAALTLLVPRSDEATAKWIALVTTILTFVVAVVLLVDFDRFKETFTTRGASKRSEHGSRGARVFRDAEDRYVLWNRRYAELYEDISDILRPGVRYDVPTHRGTVVSVATDAEATEPATVPDPATEAAKLSDLVSPAITPAAKGEKGLAGRAAAPAELRSAHAVNPETYRGLS